MNESTSNQSHLGDGIHTIGVIDVGQQREFRAQSDSPLPNNIKKTRQSRIKFQLAKERKASTTLGIIMSAFIICWLPFFVLALVRPFLRDPNSIPISVSSLFLWLGYANSTLNPIIYATLNKDFRRPFQEILCLRCSSLNNLMREDFYHSQFGPDTPTLSHVRVNAPHDRVDSCEDAPANDQLS
ncbi:hypothetical protein HAZT_HAZT011651 [Hyalella azteca]|uniref:5-hydroxytryptamine receptor 1-like n=1 Tax=Hyalella azteca TaxID=294128 RepID=A0A6A0HCL6_HYAAZ|nr:5-hydroxytryptamine receptor 1-like [Hyalella azteca]KAA0202637.1 hypothetical protein HAZT_HAZT011651 [Hyalella azteca]